MTNRLAFVSLVFGLLSASYGEGTETYWDWGASARYVWLPAAAAILVGGALGWTAGAHRRRLLREAGEPLS